MHTTATSPWRRSRWALLGALALLLALLPLTGAAAQDDTARDALDLSGDAATDYSIAWSQVTYTPLEGEVMDPPSEAIVGRDDLFADNLAAGALMGQAVDNGRPLYLTDSEDLEDDVLAEMQRVLPDGATVHVLGGEVAISQAVADEIEAAGFTVNRFEGTTRTETAIAIAQSQDSDTVLVVRSSAAAADETAAFADSLAAGALAASNGWEILFTQTDELTATTAAELEAAGYAQAYVVGGEVAVSAEVEAAIADIVPSVERVEGDNRFATAVALNELREGETGDVTLLVDGQATDAWADGFPAANLSGLNGYPLVLSNQGEIPTETEQYLSGSTTGEDGATFAAHFTGVALVCGGTVDMATCGTALSIINGDDGGEVRPFPPTGEELPPTFTDAPELVAVDVEEDTDEATVQLRFTFDEQITGKTPVAECFHLYAFDLTPFAGDDGATDCTTAGGGHEGDVNANPASADGTVAEIAGDDPSAVVVTFAVADEEMTAASVATVDWNAVQDDDLTPNLEGEVPLETAMVVGGQTSAPDLIEVRDVDADTDTVEFVFDEDVAEAITDPTGFILIDAQGDTLRSDAATRSTEQGEEDVVVAEFTDDANDDGAGPGIDTTTAGDLVRGAALAGSVTEDGGEATNPLQVVELAADGLTDDPDLVSVTVDRDQETVTYRFDVAIEVVEACGATIDPILGQPIPGTAAPETCFQVYDRSGAEVDGTDAERGTTNTDVVVTFAEGTLDDVLGASVGADAVSAVQGTENPTNEVDELPVEDQQVTAGTTVGPDLIGAEVVTTDALGTQTVVEYRFDEDVTAVEADPITGEAATPDATRFFVYDADGTPTRGETAQVDEEDPTVVQVVFDENEQVIGDAVAATVNDLAVVDDDGDSNPEGLAGLAAG